MSGEAASPVPENVRRAVDKLKLLHASDLCVDEAIACGREAIPALRELLFEREPSGLYQVRRRAVEALAGLGAHDVLMDFLRVPQETDDPVERLGDEAVVNAAALALSAVREEHVFQLLLALARRRHLSTHLVAAFRKGLGETGYVEGRNVAIDFRFAEGRYDRLPELAADLARHGVAVIATPSDLPSALAAKAATRTIPIVFGTGADPVQFGLVSSLSRPGGNVTGVSVMTLELGAKRIELLNDLVPGAARLAVLANPKSPFVVSAVEELQAAATSTGRHLEVLGAASIAEIEAAFATLAQERIAAVLNVPDVFFANRRVQIVLLAAHYQVPAMYSSREFTEVGGLMSYGPNFLDLFRQVGIYTGRVLKGEQPADLPVLRPTKFELVITLPTARLLGLSVPPTLLARADEVIE